jgi:hypothetical protein
MNENEPTGCEVQAEHEEFWFTLQTLGKLSAREKTIRDEMSRQGAKPEDIRDAIEKDRAEWLETIGSLKKEHPGAYADDDERDEYLKRNYALYDELKLLRQHVIALHETLTSQTWSPGHNNIATAEILQTLTAGGRKFLDDARQFAEDAQRNAQINARDNAELQKKLDVIVGLLAQALVTCTTKTPMLTGAGRMEPP